MTQKQRWKKGVALLTERWHVRVIALAVAIFLAFLARIDTLEERVFSVPLAIELNEDFARADDHHASVRVYVTGEKEIVNNMAVTDLVATVDLTDRKEEGTFMGTVIITRKRGALFGEEEVGIQADPSQVKIKQEKKGVRNVRVRVRFVGVLPQGYELAKSSVVPSFVTIVGPERLVDKEESIFTEEVDLSGRYEDFVASTPFVLSSPFLKIRGGLTAEVRGDIEERIVVKSYVDLPISFRDLASRFEVISPPPKIDLLRVRGKQTLLEAIEEEDLLLIVDLSPIEKAGDYRLPVALSLPEGVIVIDYLPRFVAFSITERKEIFEEEKEEEGV